MRGVGAGRLALAFARDAAAAVGMGAGGAGRALVVVDGAAPAMAAEDAAPSDPVDLVRNALRGGRRGVAGAGRRPPRGGRAAGGRGGRPLRRGKFQNRIVISLAVCLNLLLRDPSDS